MFRLFHGAAEKPKDEQVGQDELSTPRFPDEQLKMVHTDDSENETKSLLRPFEISKYDWRLAGSNWVTEARTFYMFSDKGEFILFQLAYTNAGWPLPEACQVTARFFDPRMASTPVDSLGPSEKSHHRSGFLGASSLPKNTSDHRRTPSMQVGWITAPQFQGRRKSLFGRKSEAATDTGHVRESVNQPVSKMKVSSNKTGLAVGNSTITIVGPSTTVDHTLPILTRDLDPSTPVEKDAIRTVHEGSLLDLDVLFNPLCEGVSFGDGVISFGPEASDGDIDMRFLPCGTVSGTVMIDKVPRSFRGLGMGVHQFQGIRPNLVASRWNFAYFVSDADNRGERVTFFIIQISTPPSYGSETVNYAALYGDNRLLAMSRDGKITPFEPFLDYASGYYIPREFLFEWTGVTIDGDQFSAHCHTKPNILCERMNLLDQLPFVMRKIVETFVTRPYVYQWVDRATLSISMNGKEESIIGWLYNELAILGDD